MIRSVVLTHTVIHLLITLDLRINQISETFYYNLAKIAGISATRSISKSYSFGKLVQQGRRQRVAWVHVPRHPICHFFVTTPLVLCTVSIFQQIQF